MTEKDKLLAAAIETGKLVIVHVTSTPDQRKSAKAGYHKFKNEDGGEYGSFEVFWDDSDIPKFGTEPRNFDAEGNPVQPGWYWWACSPGCVPDGEAAGPFDTSTEAFDNAMDV